MAMSLLVLAGGAQFLAVAIIAAGGGPVAAVAGGLLLNVRHLPFGLAVADVVGDRWPARVFGAHLLIDEVVAFSRARGSGARARRAYWTSGILLFTFWNAGTLLGRRGGLGDPRPGRVRRRRGVPGRAARAAAPRAATGRTLDGSVSPRP